MILFVRMNDDSVSGDMYLTSVVVSTMNVHIQQKIHVRSKSFESIFQANFIDFIFVGELCGFENFKIELKNKIKNNRKNRHFAITFCID